MQLSTELMKTMIYLTQIPEIAQVAREMSKEMTKVMNDIYVYIIKLFLNEKGIVKLNRYIYIYVYVSTATDLP